jgi:signal transduction histidine kinase
VTYNLLLALLALASNGIFYLLGQLKKNDIYFRNLGITLLVIDVLLITLFIYTKGGIESRSPILYAIPILMAAPLFGRRAIYLTALGSAFAYNVLIIADYSNIVHSQDTLTNIRTDFPYVINSIIFFDAILCVIGFLADYVTGLLVTKERQASESASALRRAQAIAKLGSWEWDVIEDRLTWSEELHKIYDLKHKPNADASYESYINRIHPDDRKHVRGIIQQALQDGRSFSFDHRVVLQDKTVRYIHSEGEVVVNKRGRSVRMFGTARDITSERALEQAKGDFVSLASHQLRTPATGVKVLLGLLAEGYAGKLSRAQRDLLTQAYDANERQLRIANDLLNVARLEAGRLKLRPKNLDLGKWLKDVLTEHESLIAGRQQKLIYNLPETTVMLQVDQDRLYMVVDNLISNASKYTPPGGTITVTVTDHKSKVQIVVSDTGIGIAKGQLSKIFQKFTRLDNRLSTEVDGSGLGLYLTKSVVDLHKGRITVKSKPGEGSAFTVDIPKGLAEQIPPSKSKRIIQYDVPGAAKKLLHKD